MDLEPQGIPYIDRVTGRREMEQVYGLSAIQFLYGTHRSRWLQYGAGFLREWIKLPFVSAVYGWWQTLSLTKRKIIPFIKKFNIDPSEFQQKVSDFYSFNDFFIRKLKPEVRPLAQGSSTAVIPADGRYRFFPNIAACNGFLVKGQKFDLKTLLQDEQLADRYAQGTMIMARLCPTDYHRYHFPVDCTPGPTTLINGWLYSVNLLALKGNIQIYTQNKRARCLLKTTEFGDVLFMEVGATNVGSINQTYLPHRAYSKGAEKGFFSFGASSLLLFFEPNRLLLDEDLLNAPFELEIRCLMGQSLGRARK